MSSRLFQRLREEAGLVYSVYSACDFHHDAGLLSIHLDVAPERTRDALRLVGEELGRLRRDGPTEAEVRSARAQLKGNIVLGQESVSNRMSHLAHEELYSGRYVTGEEQVRAVMAVTGEQVAEAARRFLDPVGFTLAAVGPAHGGPLGPADWPLPS